MHAERCAGPAEPGVPGGLSRGPLLLRTYRAEVTMDRRVIVSMGAGVEWSEPA